MNSWLPNDEKPRFGVDRSAEAYRFSDRYQPPKPSLVDRVRAAWRAFWYPE